MLQTRMPKILVWLSITGLMLVDPVAAASITGLWVSQKENGVIALRLAEVAGGKVLGTAIATLSDRSFSSRTREVNLRGQVNGTTVALNVGTTTWTGTLGRELKLGNGTQVYNFHLSTESGYQTTLTRYKHFLQQIRLANVFFTRWGSIANAANQYHKSIAVHRSRRADVRAYYERNLKNNQTCLSALKQMNAKAQMQDHGWSLPGVCTNADETTHGIDYGATGELNTLIIINQEIQDRGDLLVHGLISLQSRISRVTLAMHQTCEYERKADCTKYELSGSWNTAVTKKIRAELVTVRQTQSQIASIYAQDIAYARSANAKLVATFKMINLLEQEQ